MKINALAVAGLGSLFVASSASAVFTGLYFDTKGTTTTPGPGFFSCNIYASFDSPTDRALSVTGASLSPLGGAEFYQNPFGGATEPNPALIAVFPDLAFDTFVTIGLKQQIPGAPVTALEPGSSMTATGFTGGWFTDGDAPQGLAAPLPGVGGFHVLLMQLTIENPTVTAGFAGSMTVAWKTLTSGAQFSEVDFVGHIPAPGIVPMLALAAVAGTRRRR